MHFFQQIMRYFLANYAPKILNYVQIMQIFMHIFKPKIFNVQIFVLSLQIK